MDASLESASQKKRKQTQGGITKDRITCPHCEKIGGKPVMMRHHFENCKFKKI